MSIALLRLFGLFPLLFVLSACDPVTLTMFGVGAGTGVNYTLNGYAYKTFTAPVEEVSKAAKTALDRMGITIDSDQRSDEGHLITALAAGWNIEIMLEPISDRATRMRSHVSRSVFQKDRATATEIILQTENVMVGS